MPNPRLKIAIGSYGHTKAVKDGSVPIAGIDADLIEVNPIIAAFRRMVRDVEFDVCELARPPILLPGHRRAVHGAAGFLRRRFHHGGFVCARTPASDARTSKARRPACAPIP